MKYLLPIAAISLSWFGACGPAAPPPSPPASASLPVQSGPSTNATSAPPIQVRNDDARGGRIYDNWRSEKATSDFVPDNAKTPELDGTGGPNGNGTLNDAQGQPMPNTGHDYRLKNLFGWDLRGSEGLYGASYQNKPYVLAYNLLTDTRPASELRAWLASGGAGVPAFGAVLDNRDLDDLVEFLLKTRNKELVTPELVFDLDAGAPKGFKLRAGGDATRGGELYATRCAECHGSDGRKLSIDETESVGTIARSSGYEVWFKIAHGQPGTDMDRQLEETGGTAQAQSILDMLAALCDRHTFPALPGGDDVPDGDERCGAYLR